MLQVDIYHFSNHQPHEQLQVQFRSSNPTGTMSTITNIHIAGPILKTRCQLLLVLSSKSVPVSQDIILRL